MNDGNTTSYGCLVLVFMLIFSGIIGMFLWPYTINSWLVFYGKTAKVMWYHGFILGLVPHIWKITIPAAALTWILMLVL